MGNSHAIVWHRRCGNRITRISALYGTLRRFGQSDYPIIAEGDHLGNGHNVGVAMDRGERDEKSGVKDTDSGIDICY